MDCDVWLPSQQPNCDYNYGNGKSEFIQTYEMSMSNHPDLKVGGIVLCGGNSTRMGAPKLSLPFGPETMLQRVVRIVSEVVSPIVVVAAPDQKLPDLPENVLVAYDEHEGLGPMEGLAVGLAALGTEVDAAYVTACDTPLLKPEFIRYMIDALDNHEMVIPREGKFYHPLAAVYRTRLKDKIRLLVDADRLRPFFLVEESDARAIDVDKLRQIDPHLESLKNTNTPDEYQSALNEAGLASEANG